MRLDRIALENFRNYAAQQVGFDPVCNVICGENAQGKTNLLEAMVCLSMGKSHRTRADRELIRFDQEGFRLEASIRSRDRDFISHIDVGFGKKKRITVNQVPIKAAAAHSECSGGREQLSIQYKTVKTVTDPFGDHKLLVVQLLEHQREHHYAEVSSRQCLSGPHKDDMEVLLDGLSARSYASQGQTRTAALSLKLAAREIHKEIIGEYPILLLDDVLSELDPKRQEYVLNRIGSGQVFITCCEEDRLHSLLKGNVYRVKNGIVTQQ